MKSIHAQTAAAARNELKSAFPGIKFDVMSKSYTGGSSITIHYTDGVKTSRVQAIVAKYSYENNRDNSIPQTRFVFVTREMSVDACLEIATEYGIEQNEITKPLSRFHGEYGSRVIYAAFSDREFGQWAGVFTPNEKMDEPDVMGSFDENGDVIGAASDDAPGFVVITTGDDVERIDELFDTSESNATEVTPDDVVAAIRGGGKIGLLPLYPMPERMPAVLQTIEYPNDVTFDVVYSKFPHGQILRVTEALTPAGEWHSVTMYFTENGIEFWTVAEAIQRLIDQIDARAFTLEIEDEHGRIKNPDFTAAELVLENRSN